MKKRLISICIMFTMLISCIAIPGVAEESSDSATTQANNAQDTPQAETVSKYSAGTSRLLQAIGVVSDDYSSRLNENVTRGEFAKIAVETMGFKPESFENSEKDDFTDVHPMSEIGSYVKAAKNLGLVKGYDSDSFGASDEILYQDALLILLRVIGYGEFAENLAGIPAALSRTKLTQGVPHGSESTITFGETLELVKNAVDTDLMTVIRNGSKRQYIVNPGSTLLNQVFFIDYVSGIVTANEYTAIYDVGTLLPGEIKIDNITYQINDPIAYSYLGSRVDAYVDAKKNGVPKIVYIVESAKNRSLRIPVKYLVKFSDTEIDCVDENDREKRLQISDTANVIYNNRYLCKYYDFDKKLAESIYSGGILLKDNDSNGRYDVLLITDQKVDCVSSYDKNTSMLYCEDGAYDLSNQAREVVIFLASDGAVLADFPNNSNAAVGIAESPDKKTITVITGLDSVSGSVEYVDNYGVTINGEYYNYSKRYESKDFILNSDLKVYMDVDGQIVYKKGDTSGTKGGWTYGVVSAAEAVYLFENTCRLRVFDQFGKMNTYDVSSRFVLDGEVETDGMKVVEALNLSVTENVNQVIKYILNDKGEIQKIDTIQRGEKEDELSLRINTEPNRESLIYKTTQTLGEGRFYGGKAIVFSAPMDSEALERYQISSLSTLSNDATYTFSVYDCDEYNTPAVIVIHSGSNQTVVEDSKVFVVEGISTSINEDGDTVHYIKGGFNNEIQDSLWYSDSGLVPDISPGDIIQVSRFPSGELTAYKVLRNSETAPSCSKGSSSFNYSYGTVVEFNRETGACIIETMSSTGEPIRRLSLLNNVNGYLVSGNEKKKTISTISSSAIVVGKMIYVRERYLQPIEFVLYD